MAEAAALMVRSLTKTHPHFGVANMALLDVGDRITLDGSFYAFKHGFAGFPSFFTE